MIQVTIRSLVLIEAIARIVAAELRHVEVLVHDTCRHHSSSRNHELLPLTLKDDRAICVVCTSLALEDVCDELPLLCLEGILDLALGLEENGVVLFVEDGEVSPVKSWSASVSDTFSDAKCGCLDAWQLRKRENAEKQSLT